MAERDIIARLRLAGEEFSRELNDTLGDVAPAAERAGNDAGERFSSGFGSKLAGLAIASAAAIGAAGEAIAKSLDYAANLDTSSRSLNVNAESLQLWRHAAREVGASAEELDATLDSLNGNIKSAHDGNRTAQQSFVDLGVGFETVSGKVRETDAVFRDVIERLSKIEDPSKRAEMAASVLGDEFDRLLPLAQGGAKGLDEVEAAARRLGVALTNDELKNLNETNQKLADMRDILSVRIASTVAENADAIIALADGMGYVAEKAAGAVRWYREFKLEQGLRLAQNTRDGWFTTDANRAVANEQIEQYQLQLARMRGQVDKSGSFRDYSSTPLVFGGPSAVAAPTVDPKPSRKTGGSGRSAGKSDEQKAAEQAAREREAAIKRAWEQEKKLSTSIDETILKQQDSVRVEQVRAGLGERAAAEEEARLAFEREHPEAVAQSVAQLAVMLGITKDIVTANKTLTEEQKAQLQADIDKLGVAKQGVVKAAGDKADVQAAKEARDAAEQRDRLAQQATERWKRQQEAAIRDIAYLYEDLFTGGVDKVWKDFKSIGLRVISEVAAKWTLATISGQSINVGQALNTGISQSPLGALFGSGRSLFGGSTAGANDNGASKAFEEAFGGMPGYTPGINPDAVSAGSRIGGAGTLLSGASSVLGPLALASAANSMIGDVLGFKGGPLGIFTSLFDGIFSKTKKGYADDIRVSADGDVNFRTVGNNSKREAVAGSLAGQFGSTLADIADQLGGGLNSSLNLGSLGMRKDKYTFDPTPGNKAGRQSFDTEQEATAAALEYAISKGVLTGLSRSQENILKSGKDLEESINKAALLGSVPKLLRQRLDPLGVALDEVDAKFRDLADTLKEGGASADEIAQARQLWQLEREDTIKQIGDASATLKNFLASLAVGSNSPLSLRQQEVSAREALSPYTAQIEAAKVAQATLDRLKSSGGSAADIKTAEEAARIAAGKIDQEGFQAAAQALLGIERSINGSSSGFFDQFNQIKQLTSDAANLIDAVTTKSTDAATDPFSAAIAASTSDAANILFDQTKQLSEMITQLQAMNDNLSAKTSWINELRGY